MRRKGRKESCNGEGGGYIHEGNVSITLVILLFSYRVCEKDKAYLGKACERRISLVSQKKKRETSPTLCCVREMGMAFFGEGVLMKLFRIVFALDKDAR